jgi:hypothetical protein
MSKGSNCDDDPRGGDGEDDGDREEPAASVPPGRRRAGTSALDVGPRNGASSSSRVRKSRSTSTIAVLQESAESAPALAEVHTDRCRA